MKIKHAEKSLNIILLSVIKRVLGGWGGEGVREKGSDVSGSEGAIWLKHIRTLLHLIN